MNEERKNGIQSSNKNVCQNSVQNVEKSIAHEKLKYSRNDRRKQTYTELCILLTSQLDILLNFDSLVPHGELVRGNI